MHAQMRVQFACMHKIFAHQQIQLYLVQSFNIPCLYWCLVSMYQHLIVSGCLLAASCLHVEFAGNSLHGLAVLHCTHQQAAASQQTELNTLPKLVG